MAFSGGIVRFHCVQWMAIGHSGLLGLNAQIHVALASRRGFDFVLDWQMVVNHVQEKTKRTNCAI